MSFDFWKLYDKYQKTIEKNEKPLQQLIKRYKEIEHVSLLSLKGNSNNKKLYVCNKLHNNGPICDNNVKSQYLQISNDKFYLNCKNFANNCI